MAQGETMAQTAPVAQATDELDVSIVMPCLNEAETVEGCVRHARWFLGAQGLAGEVIVADNGSTDGSATVAQRAGARVVQVSERGYGCALKAGINAARGRWIIMGDADASYDFSHLAGFIERLRQGDDLVMGNRYRGGIKPGAMPPLNRYVGNPVLTAIGRIFFGSRVGDFYCGLRGFSKAAAERMRLQSPGMEFATEMVVKATLLKMRVTEVPITLSPDGRNRPPHLRPWRDGWRTLRFFLIYSPRWLFWYPGLALIGAGVVIGWWLFPQGRSVGRVTLDVHTLLYAAMAILVGFQAVSFAVFTKVFGQGIGLLPEDPRVERLMRIATLEWSLVAGGACILLGLGGSACALWIWGRSALGPLDPFKMMRLVIPSVTLLVLGCQIVLVSFFLSILRFHLDAFRGTRASDTRP